MPEPGSLAAHSGEITLVLEIVLSIAGVLAVFVLGKIDRNQSEIFRRLTVLENDFHEMRGEHNAMKGACR